MANLATFFGRGRSAILMRMLGIADREVTLARRGFTAPSDAARQHLETIGRSFLHGYHAALRTPNLLELDHALAETDSLYRGFVYEGAGMALALMDHLLPARRPRWRRFLSGPGIGHCYMLQVGYGWAVARLPWLRRDLGRLIAGQDHLLRWLTVDGYGFHEGYFYGQRYFEGLARPSRLKGYELNVFDQGLGRSLWFRSGTDPARLVELLTRFPEERRADLWSGAGLACAYAGVVGADALKYLANAAGQYRGHVAQGVSFAAKARQQAGNPAEHTELACRELLRMDATSAAQITQDELFDLPLGDSARPAYEIWRTKVRDRLTHEAVAT